MFNVLIKRKEKKKHHVTATNECSTGHRSLGVVFWINYVMYFKHTHTPYQTGWSQLEYFLINRFRTVRVVMELNNSHCNNIELYTL